MTDTRRRQLLAAGLLGAVVPAWAQRATPSFARSDYAPEPFQPGKDVVWLPTPDALVTRMLQLAGVGRRDHVIDLGAGDGRIVIAAARQFGATGLGIEFNPELVAHARRRARAAGVAERARFVQGDIFEADLSAASVVSMYLLPELNLKLRPTLLALKPGTRLVTHAFGMGTWQPDEHSRAGGATAYLWLVPANVGGRWRLRYARAGQAVNLPMTVRQVFQFPRGEVELGSAMTSLRDARVIGERARWAFTDSDGRLRRFDGRVEDDRIEGTVTDDGGATARFTAERQGAAPAIAVSA